MPQQLVTVLGSTGSIGVSTLDVISSHPNLFKIFALTAHSRIHELIESCKKFCPQYIVTSNPEPNLAVAIKNLGLSTIVLHGDNALEQVASDPAADIVVAGIVGAAGLKSVLASARTGKRILLANKEALVMAGSLFMNTVRNSNAELLPVDSEHSAIFQCLQGNKGNENCYTRRLILTASGGPFLNTPREELIHVTPDQACSHPKWTMGRKISVDSATMMNKGLEVIEARWLFDFLPEQIDVVIHPQSIVHSFVEFVDGSMLAQLGTPDMRTSISYALAYPKRIDSGVEPLNLFDVGKLDFLRPNLETFPCLQLAYNALSIGGNASTLLNAANEIAVGAFLDGHLSFVHIPKVLAKVMETANAEVSLSNYEQILAADQAGRSTASTILNAML